jgi:hypothetical protein
MPTNAITIATTTTMRPVLLFFGTCGPRGFSDTAL